MNREVYHGFLNLLEIANYGKRQVVESFDTNDGKIIDIIILENLFLDSIINDKCLIVIN
jgi:hypothetical protein